MTGFATLYGKLQQKTSISGKADSTLNNYARCLAHLALHFDCSPELLDIEEYLHNLKKVKVKNLRVPKSNASKA